MIAALRAWVLPLEMRTSPFESALLYPQVLVSQCILQVLWEFMENKHDGVAMLITCPALSCEEKISKH